VSKRQSAALLKLYRRARVFAFEDPSIPEKSRKHRFNKPTREMLELTQAAVTAGRVRHVAPAKKLQGMIVDDTVRVSRWGYMGFSVK